MFQRGILPSAVSFSASILIARLSPDVPIGSLNEREIHGRENPVIRQIHHVSEKDFLFLPQLFHLLMSQLRSRDRGEQPVLRTPLNGKGQHENGGTVFEGIMRL